MNRIVEVEIAGSKCPLNFSAKAAKEISNRYDGIENAMSAFDGKSVDAALTELIWLIHLLNEQGAAYRKIVEGVDTKCFTEDELEIVIGIDDMPVLKDGLFAAMAAGMSRTVEVEDDPKNADATQD